MNTIKPNNQKLVVTYLSTYFENIGDDFIRLGISYLLNKIYNNEIKEYHVSKSNSLSYLFNLNKWTHSPRWQMNKNQQWITDRIYFFLLRIGFQKRFYKRIEQSNVIILAGTPLFFFTKGEYTFLKNMNWPSGFYGEIKKHFPGKKIFCVGAGSIYDFSVDDLSVTYPEELKFLNNFVNDVDFLAVRDSKTKQLLSVASQSNNIIQLACPSIFSSRKYTISRGESSKLKNKTIVLSYSEESANIDLNKENTISKRREILDKIVTSLTLKGYKLSFFAHNKVDKDLHKYLKAQYPHIKLEKGSSEDFLKLISSVDLLISWRVHGAMGAASLGCPAILFKTDSRASTTEIFDLDVVDDRVSSEGEIMNIINKNLELGYTVKVNNIDVVDKLEREYIKALVVGL